MVGRKPQGSELSRQVDVLAHASDRRPNLVAHSKLLGCMSQGEVSRATDSVLQLQRTFGNRYVQRVVALARQENADRSVSPTVEAAIERSRAGGQPLDRDTRHHMESAFGADFSGVRIHTGAESHALSRVVNAVAFTTGHDIFFRDGAYTPATSAGKELLAHELTHVVQQGASSVISPAIRPAEIQRLCPECEEQGKKKGLQRSLEIGKSNDPSEHEADRIAKAVMRTLNSGNAPDGHRGEMAFQPDTPGFAGSPNLQRSIGDGHDLQSPRFAGDPVLEAVFDNERLLLFGSRGPAVQRIQQALVDAGFPLPKFGVDGAFMSETQAAVRSYQRAHGLDPDGIVGPLTMGSLDALFAGPVPPKPGPKPPAPAETITSETVVTAPAPRTRTKIGVGEEVNLTHSPGSAAWTTTAGKLSAANGTKVILTAPDTTQKITVTAGTATLDFEVIAPTTVAMDREPGTAVKHHLNRPDSGIQTRVFLGPDTVNFNKVIYHEMDVAGVPTNPGVYSCNTFSTGHCGAGAGNPCPDKLMNDTVIAGKGTQSVLGDCAYSGFCAGTAPFTPGSISLSIPYEYKIGTGAFHPITNVPQTHALAADGSTLTSDKAGAHGATTVAAPNVVIVQCP